MCLSAVLGLASVASSAIGASGANRAADAQTDAANTSVGLQRDIYEDITSRMEPYSDAGGFALEALLFELGLGDAPMIGGTPLDIETFTETIPATSGGGAPAGIDRSDRENFIQSGGGGTPARNVTRYRVGENVFDTMDEARAYADANPTGGRAYEGYSMSPMAQYALTEGLDSIGASAIGRGSLNSGAALKAAEDYRYGVVTRDRGEYLDRLTGMAASGQNAAGNLASSGQAYASNAGNALMAGGQAASQGIINSTNAIMGGIGNFANIYGYMNSNPMQNYSTSYSTGATPGVGLW